MKVLAVFAKEMLDTFRDQRSLVSALAYVLLGPLAVVFTVNVLAAATRTSALEPVAICSGAAPELVDHLATTGIVFAESADVCLDVPEDFAERVAGGRTARVAIRANMSAASATVTKLETEIARYARGLAVERAMARGLAPSVLGPITVDRRNTNPVSIRADVIARLLVVFFVMAPFFVSVAAAADMTAGERERRSLEGLLAYPVRTIEIVLGKWLAAAAIGVLGTAICIFAGLWLMQRSALPELGLRLATGVDAGLTALLMLVPICLLSAAVQIAVGLGAKSYKDAQSYLTLLTFVPGVAGFVLAGERLPAAGGWPIGAELVALRAPLLGSVVAAPPFLQTVLIELALAAVALWLAAARLRSERVLLQG
jgi:sodium transport system permease protein